VSKQTEEMVSVEICDSKNACSLPPFLPPIHYLLYGGAHLQVYSPKGARALYPPPHTMQK
jgi:hypothetical protein